MPDRNLDDLDADLYPLCIKFIDACHAQGINVIITETYRSSEQQDADFAQGRTLPGRIITNARGGESPHNCTDDEGKPASCAFDFAIRQGDGTLDWNAADPAWQTALSIGKGLALVSGGDWHSPKDYPHFELKDWKD